MACAPKTYIALDFETAGYYSHSACAIGMTKICGGEIVDEYYSLIRPPSSKICFTYIHGLSWQDLKDKESFAVVWEQARNFLTGAAYFIAHNAPFDRRVLYACCEAFALEVPHMPFLCTYKGAKRVLQLESYSLDALAGYFGFELQHHNAASDARNCARIFNKLLKMGVAEEEMLCREKRKNIEQAGSPKSN